MWRKKRSSTDKQFGSGDRRERTLTVRKSPKRNDWTKCSFNCDVRRELLVQLCRPIENDGHGLRLCINDLRVNQKSLPVAAHVVDESIIS